MTAPQMERLMQRVVSGELRVSGQYRIQPTRLDTAVGGYALAIVDTAPTSPRDAAVTYADAGLFVLALEELGRVRLDPALAAFLEDRLATPGQMLRGPQESDADLRARLARDGDA